MKMLKIDLKEMKMLKELMSEAVHVDELTRGARRSLVR